MRERLIEILKGFRTPICEGLNFKLPDVEAIADYLLSEGVIALPCKVGDKVYVMESENTGFYECEIVTVVYDGIQWLGYMNCLWRHCHGGYWKWQECDIGKTVFLTKEEAEKAIAEREVKE